MPVQLPIVGDSQVRRRSGGRPLRVGQLARRSGKTVRALHLYEEMGLLDPVSRSQGGYRLYDEDAITRVRWITKLQELGLSLSEIRTLADEWQRSGSAPGAMERAELTLRTKLEETREQIARLRTLERELRASLEYLATCPRCNPQQLVEACSSCELHEQEQPDLVAGFHAH